jgi:hypothetical protein
MCLFVCLFFFFFFNICECTRLGMVATQFEGKTISLDDELSILQGIVKLVGLIFLANVPRL